MNDTSWSYPPSKKVVLTPEGLKMAKLAKSKLTLTPLTQEEWDELDPKARWDSQVALRGPDLASSDTLKYFTTSVIRYRMSKVMRVGGMVNSAIPFVVVPYTMPLDKKGGFSISHFTGHILDASMWLKIPRCVVKADTYVNLMAPGASRWAVIKDIYQGIDDPDQKAFLKSALQMNGVSLSTEDPDVE